LAHYQRSLEVGERLLEANKDSAQAARDVSVSLKRLGDFLARRGLPGDAEKALAHYQRSLEVRERLLEANKDSAQAARDVMVSLERMARAKSEQPGAEAARQALEFQRRALGIAVKLREGNPQSAFYGRTAALSFHLTAKRAQAAGDQELANRCLAGCHKVLHELVTAGCQLDAPMMQLYQQLNEAAGGPPSKQ
jgi:tetratricopeptide (TPR) repeat protein